MKRATAHEAQRHPWLHTHTHDDHRNIAPAEEKKSDRYAQNADSASNYDSKDKLDTACGPGSGGTRNGSAHRRRIELSEEKCGRDNDAIDQRRAESKKIGCKDEY